jgi:hypothetical protein
MVSLAGNVAEASTVRHEAWAHADVRFEPGDAPALLDLLEHDPAGTRSMIVLGNPTWVDYYALLAPEAVKVSAGRADEIQGLIVFAEMAMQHGTRNLLIADVEGMVSAVGAAWAAFFVRSLVRIADRHGAKVTMTVNPKRLTATQLEVILGSSGTPKLARPGPREERRPKAAEILGVRRPVAGQATYCASRS